KQKERAVVNKIKTFFDFIRDVRSEAFKITWPTRDIVIRSAILILSFAGVMALFFFLVDSVLNKIVGWIF
ncbi:MAG: preprotein translocase subunit SecE, partial [Rickettsiales bacterium]|nr:preprotein translocase subunit SecE [Rickettsiales bacterium]